MLHFVTSKKTVYITLGIVAVAVIGIGGYLRNANPTDPQSAMNNAQNSAKVGWGSVQITESESQPAATSAQSNTSAQDSAGGQSTEDNTATSIDFSNPKTFTHEARNFSFEYPQDLRVGRFDQADTEIIVVQNPNERVGFQISIRSIDEQIAMTKARIQEDLPDLQVRQPQPVQLGADAGQGLAFYSDNEAFGGDSREVWFTFNNHLYQISTYANLDPLLKQVLNSWTFL